MKLLLCALLVVLAGLWACSPTGIFPKRSDGAPLRAISPDDVAPAIPRADPIRAAGNKSPYTVNGVEYEVLSDYRNYRARGMASWYGTKFHGRQTSNGEIFDLYAATAAHRSLPIPSYVEVTNLENGRSIVVRVNDRGPFHADRIIDLSYGAAVKLGYMEQGTTAVEVRALHIAGVEDHRHTPGGDYRYLQVGAFSQESSARKLQAELAGQVGAPVGISPVQSNDSLLYRVRIGPLADSKALRELQTLLGERGYGPAQALP
jgi:rare lipoprotein A